MRAMPIIRSRTGCFTCRRRKKKCNEEKPLCSGCRRNHLECTWPTETNNTLQTRPKPLPTSKSSTSPTAAAAVAVTNPSPDTPHLTTTAITTDKPMVDAAITTITTTPTPTASSATHDSLATASTTFRDRTHSHSSSESSNHDDASDHVEIITSHNTLQPQLRLISDASPDLVPVSPVSSVSPVPSHHGPDMFPDNNHARALTVSSMTLAAAADPSLLTLSPLSPLSLLPNHGRESSDLLSYYLTRTANSMGNGSTDVNPFIAKLVPLAFANPLVLQLLLAQSASHRQSADASPLGTEVAHHYYADSLRMFRNVVGEYVSGKDDNALALTVGSLILCLTEVARGDVHGTVFDHLRASESMLSLLLTRPDSHIPDDLPDFLVEFAIHMTVTSIMSTDPKRAPPELSPVIEGLARTLIAKGYVGQLSGCWLELLLLIPHVYHLGHRIMATRLDDGTLSPQPDDIITFGILQSQIMAFFPDASVNPYSRLAALVFKQGVLLYLWSILGTPHQHNPPNPAHANLMAAAVAEALSLLAQFPATLRINTSLCWPLTVIGCCTTDPDVQRVLCHRLQTMHATIGLGNMKETLILLQHIWTKDPHHISPWKLSDVMQERQVWFSFA
ncbi:C6 transcription factor [Cordyceps javanica]|uniref:C6 transcription factor n=1 Tax=Cordyceps javanica TaxID=43265 RepID=A0A545UVY7_9HYPO|nr:C6 transcription factor [Cordyceps javanica]TQW02364.1 C6 transcription factor [Cordyceps javanica]